MPRRRKSPRSPGTRAFGSRAIPRSALPVATPSMPRPPISSRRRPSPRTSDRCSASQPRTTTAPSARRPPAPGRGCEPDRHRVQCDRFHHHLLRRWRRDQAKSFGHHRGCAPSGLHRRRCCRGAGPLLGFDPEGDASASPAWVRDDFQVERALNEGRLSPGFDVSSLARQWTRSATDYRPARP